MDQDWPDCRRLDGGGPIGGTVRLDRAVMEKSENWRIATTKCLHRVIRLETVVDESIKDEIQRNAS